MPGGNWRWGMVAAGVVWACAGGSVHAQGTVPALVPVGATLPPAGPAAPAAPLSPAGPPATRTAAPATRTAVPAAPTASFGTTPTTPVAPPGGSPTALPSVSTGHEDIPLKDLTPPGFATEGPGEGFGNHNGHGHLNPLVPEEPGLFANAELLVLRPRRGAFDFVVKDPLNGLATPTITTGNLPQLMRTLGPGVMRWGGNVENATFWTSTGETARPACIGARPGDLDAR